MASRFARCPLHYLYRSTNVATPAVPTNSKNIIVTKTHLPHASQQAPPTDVHSFTKAPWSNIQVHNGSRSVTLSGPFFNKTRKQNKTKKLTSIRLRSFTALTRVSTLLDDKSSRGTKNCPPVEVDGGMGGFEVGKKLRAEQTSRHFGGLQNYSRATKKTQ